MFWSIVDYVSLEERITARVLLRLRLGLLLFFNYVPRETGVHITTQRCIALIVMLTERSYDYSTNSMRLWTRPTAEKLSTKPSAAWW